MRIPYTAQLHGWTAETVEAEALQSGQSIDEVLEGLRLKYAPIQGPPSNLKGALFEKMRLPGTEGAPKLTDPPDFVLPSGALERGWTPELVRIQAWAEAKIIPELLSEIARDCASQEGEHDYQPYVAPMEGLEEWPEQARARVASLDLSGLDDELGPKHPWWKVWRR